MPTVHDDAVCIRHWDWSETSQTLTLFARRGGIVRALAKGSRRPKAPYSGGIELLTLGEAGLIIRPNSELALLTEWDLRETFPALRRGLLAFNAGMYFADLVQRFVRDHDPHPALFDALLIALRGLEVDPIAGVLTFQWAVLLEAGFRPTLGANGVCLVGPASPNTLRFDPRLGGILDDPEESGAVAPRALGSWLVRRETVELLRRVATSVGTDIAGDQPARPVVLRAARLLGAYIRHILGEEPRTQPLVLGRVPGEKTDARVR